MGRPPIATRAMTGAERLRRHRAKRGYRRPPDPTNAARQQRWRDRQAAKQMPEPVAPDDPLLAQAVAHLTAQGDTGLIGRLHASWPHMAVPVRQQMAIGKGFRFWLRE